MNEVKAIPIFKGHEIILSGKEYILPPLPIKAYSKGDATERLKKIQEEGKSLKEDGITAFSKESINSLVSLTTTALQRNYPEITEEDVEDGFSDLMSLFECFQYLLSQDKVVQQKMKEAQKNVLAELAKKAGK